MKSPETENPHCVAYLRFDVVVADNDFVNREITVPALHCADSVHIRQVRFCASMEARDYGNVVPWRYLEVLLHVGDVAVRLRWDV